MTIKLKPRARIATSRHRSKDAESDVRNIIIAVCLHFKISVDQIFMQSRKAEIVKPRHVATYLILSRRICTTSDVAFIFRQDHTTVISAERRCLYALDTKSDVYQDITEITEKLNKHRPI